MRALVVSAIVSCAACSGEPIAIEDDSFLQDAAIDLTGDLSSHPGCASVQWCLAFTDSTGQSFTQCVLPGPPGQPFDPAFMPYFDCVRTATSTGACAAACGHPDLDVVSDACYTCLDGTCAGGTCSGGACSSEATACGLTR